MSLFALLLFAEQKVKYVFLVKSGLAYMHTHRCE